MLSKWFNKKKKDTTNPDEALHVCAANHAEILQELKRLRDCVKAISEELDHVKLNNMKLKDKIDQLDTFIVFDD